MTKKQAAAEGTHKQRTLRDRAKATKASAKRVVRRDSGNQPSQETLPPESSGGQRNAAFPVNDRPAHGAPQGLDGKQDRDGAGDRRQPKGEADMGRHERFDLAIALAEQAPAGAIDISDTGHPDHELFKLKMAWEEADAVSRAASKLHSLAYREFWDALGPCPAVLRVHDDEHGSLTTPLNRSLTRGIRFEPVRWFDDETEAGTRDHRSDAWTPDSLRRTIAVAVPIFGCGGTTPRRIGRYRSLLPIAEEFFGRYDELQRHLQTKELASQSCDAGRRVTQLGEDLSRISATTVSGLTIIAERMNDFSWEGMHASWRNLLRSAAAVSGVQMREPRYNVDRFIGRLERAGGAVALGSRERPGRGLLAGGSHPPLVEARRDQGSQPGLRRVSRRDPRVDA